MSTIAQEIFARDVERVCACGEANVSSWPVCPDCWFRVPRGVRNAFEFGRRPAQRRYVERVMVAFARARAVDRDVEFSKQPTD